MSKAYEILRRWWWVFPVVIVAACIVGWLIYATPIWAAERRARVAEIEARRIWVYTPDEAHALDHGELTLEKLRRHVIKEGETSTKVDIYLDPKSPYRGARVTIEFEPDSTFESVDIRSWGDRESGNAIIPPGAWVYGAVDGKPSAQPGTRPDHDGSFHYRLAPWKRPFQFPPGVGSGSDVVSFMATVLWSCEINSGGGEYDDTYLMRPDPSVIPPLLLGLGHHRNLTSDGKRDWGQVTGGGTPNERYLVPLRKKHGLSDSTEFSVWSRADSDWLIGVDTETGLIYWNYYDT